MQTNYESDASRTGSDDDDKLYHCNSYIFQVFTPLHCVVSRTIMKKKKIAFLYHNETKLDEKKYIYFSQSFYLLIIVRFSCFILWKKVKKKKKLQ